MTLVPAGLDVGFGCAADILVCLAASERPGLGPLRHPEEADAAY
jgi:hypothetical protein